MRRLRHDLVEVARNAVQVLRGVVVGSEDLAVQRLRKGRLSRNERRSRRLRNDQRVRADNEECHCGQAALRTNPGDEEKHRHDHPTCEQESGGQPQRDVAVYRGDRDRHEQDCRGRRPPPPTTVEKGPTQFAHDRRGYEHGRRPQHRQVEVELEHLLLEAELENRERGRLRCERREEERLGVAKSTLSAQEKKEPQHRYQHGNQEVRCVEDPTPVTRVIHGYLLGCPKPVECVKGRRPDVGRPEEEPRRNTEYDRHANHGDENRADLGEEFAHWRPQTTRRPNNERAQHEWQRDEIRMHCETQEPTSRRGPSPANSVLGRHDETAVPGDQIRDARRVRVVGPPRSDEHRTGEDCHHGNGTRCGSVQSSEEQERWDDRDQNEDVAKRVVPTDVSERSVRDTTGHRECRTRELPIVRPEAFKEISTVLDDCGVEEGIGEPRTREELRSQWPHQEQRCQEKQDSRRHARAVLTPECRLDIVGRDPMRRTGSCVGGDSRHSRRRRIGVVHGA